MTWLSQRSGASVAPVRLTVAKWVGAAVGAASRMSGRGQGIVLAGRTINAREADGFDTSWLWEVPFEELGRRAVGVHGEQRADLALRLEVAGIMHVVEKDINLLARNLPEGPCVVQANYTAFTALRGRL